MPTGNANPDGTGTDSLADDTNRVHVHPGFNGIQTDDPDTADEDLPALTAARYDWRNPMLRVTAKCMMMD